MKLLVSVALIVLSQNLFAYTICDRMPHSLKCMDETFVGKIFPVEKPFSGKRVKHKFMGLWSTELTAFQPYAILNRYLQITYYSDFQQGIYNNDGSPLGDVEIFVKESHSTTGKKRIAMVKANDYLAYNYSRSSNVQYIDEYTIGYNFNNVFNRYEQHHMQCRYFKRKPASSPRVLMHALCRVYINNQYQGYLGYVKR